MEAERHVKTMRGLETGWLETGTDDAERPLVVLLHGYPDVPECWEFQVESLSPRYRIIAPYVRGVAPSEKARDLHRYGPDSVAMDVLEMLDSVDPSRTRRVFLVGHDLGAVHAWHLAGLLQKRVAGLAVINGLGLGQMVRRLKHPRQAAKSWYIYLAQVPQLPEALINRFAPKLLRFAHEMGGLSRSQRPDLEKVRPGIVDPVNQYRAFLREAPRAVRSPRRRLDCPVLVVFGAEDAFLEPPTQAELSPDAANLTIRILPGNHWLHREDPGKVNKILTDFFARHERADAGARQ